jgi:hypothetical protein
MVGCATGCDGDARELHPALPAEVIPTVRGAIVPSLLLSVLLAIAQRWLGR